jgi:protein subunit release factor B
MSDSLPDYQVEQQKLKSQIAAQHANIERQKLEILEMASRKRKHEENIVAAHKAIVEMEGNLRSLAETHGELTDKRFEEMKSSLP